MTNKGGRHQDAAACSMHPAPGNGNTCAYNSSTHSTGTHSSTSNLFTLIHDSPRGGSHFSLLPLHIHVSVYFFAFFIPTPKVAQSVSGVMSKSLKVWKVLKIFCFSSSGMSSKTGLLKRLLSR